MLFLWRTRVLLLLLLCLASQQSDGRARMVETREMDCSSNCSQQGLPCRVEKECDWWCTAYNATQCPQTPSKPSLKRPEPFVFQSGDGENAKYHLGLNITWEPPDDGSIVFVRGFQIRVMSRNSDDLGWNYCVTLNITGAKLSMVAPKRKFYYNCFGKDPDNPKIFLPGKTYHIVLYSKPEQGPGHKDQNVSRDITMPDCDRPGMEKVEECKAYINVSVNGSTVNVTFDPAPSTFIFDGYFVWLKPTGDKGEERELQTTTSNVLFQDVPNGRYTVKLRLKKRECDCIDSMTVRPFIVQAPAAPGRTNHFSVIPVLLIYSHDHPLHETAVRAFAAFLRQICGCDVTLDDYCMQSIARLGKIPWLCGQIERAKRVIVVCSKGTKRIWEDIVNAEPSVMSRYAPPCGDMVRPAIHLISSEFHRQSTFEKYITAYFRYSSEEDVPRALNVGNNYMLMKHFEELYLHLLRWDRRPARPDIALPELGEDRYHLSEAGGKLKRCIDEMTAFQTAHPTWFQDSQGSSQACGGGDDTCLHPYYSHGSHGNGQQHDFGGFYSSPQLDGQSRNYGYDADYERSSVSLVAPSDVSIRDNRPFGAQHVTDQSRDVFRREFSESGGRTPDTVPPCEATFTNSPPVMNNVVPNGGVAEGHTHHSEPAGDVVPEPTESDDISTARNLTGPNLHFSPSVFLLEKHVQQFRGDGDRNAGGYPSVSRGGQASEDEGIDTLVSQGRVTDV
ncbi:PREDICTED: LOW QUALITY PROTEIN: interleukin-17 receptor A-like [Branchiostoma belcheri]|uniref:LOW QUALITY PROTEIN: interleukin-17 receptor A-like n=1 Tax=Branchiostoma belcheri TaxID=7741 RepID=A0A6P4Z9Z6_BRABE|nr:PREDICTED: LOW QUALITY PROTEIN: interleukin-17 receptor A-like [Branchiostoma belcheri]